ncbi:OsmC family protein [Dethiobacter alkaliphilus AHT 1]|uniref:OsmC family protein n=2 Tax=Dethiobacter TaxID=427925 RepID=C0GJS9_DETAL|nr:OsmC family protein [Dethiobacter alkaliphilus AHT 1]
MKTKVKWMGEQSYVAVDNNGLEVKISPKPQQNDMLKPPDLLLMSLGSCTGLFFLPAAKELGLAIEHFEVVVTGEKANNPPKLFSSIHIHIDVWGQVTEDKVEKAIEKGHDKCFILHSLNPDIEIKTSFELKNS